MVSRLNEAKIYCDCRKWNKLAFLAITSNYKLIYFVEKYVRYLKEINPRRRDSHVDVSDRNQILHNIGDDEFQEFVIFTSEIHLSNDVKFGCLAHI